MMSGTVSASVLAGVGEGARLYLRMTDGAEPEVVAAAAGAACACGQAFLAADLAVAWDAVPAGVAQGLVLLCAHLVEHREANAMPPLAIAALWRPFRVMRLRREAVA